MARRRTAPHTGGFGAIEHRLTMHLERAHELGERATRANGAVQHEIECAQQIAHRLMDRVHPRDAAGPPTSRKHRT